MRILILNLRSAYHEENEKNYSISNGDGNGA